MKPTIVRLGAALLLGFALGFSSTHALAVSAEEIMERSQRAFHYAGRPYDYHFDFRSDQALVCSELVYKAYRELPGESGLALPLERTLGRPMMTPNTLAQIFSEEGHERFALVRFLDGDERAGVARVSTAEAFKTSWSRPTWHILLPVDDASFASW